MDFWTVYFFARDFREIQFTFLEAINSQNRYTSTYCTGYTMNHGVQILQLVRALFNSKGSLPLPTVKNHHCPAMPDRKCLHLTKKIATKYQTSIMVSIFNLKSFSLRSRFKF
ncbi:unnamed protein product [Durusdinium trenchii]|uniref:Uncharacterized protein n=1 Tax=Durusdinium trenchii TaxID=1381693 RepID=A0ABP0LTZ1_9DINO